MVVVVSSNTGRGGGVEISGVVGGWGGGVEYCREEEPSNTAAFSVRRRYRSINE